MMDEFSTTKEVASEMVSEDKMRRLVEMKEFVSMPDRLDIIARVDVGVGKYRAGSCGSGGGGGSCGHCRAMPNED